MSDKPKGFWDSLLSAKGRNNRVRYWQVTGLFFVSMLVIGVGAAQFDESSPLWILMPGVALLVVAVVLFFLVNLFNNIKRLHDLGRSGWWYLLVFVIYAPVAALATAAREAHEVGAAAALSLLEMILTAAILAIFGALPGQSRSNRFGEPPGAPTAAAATEQAA
jgi:uncharacterized membrane protein YhaH (DUF805 family)